MDELCFNRSIVCESGGPRLIELGETTLKPVAGDDDDCSGIQPESQPLTCALLQSRHSAADW